MSTWFLDSELSTCFVYNHEGHCFVHTRTRAWSIILVAICFDGNVCNMNMVYCDPLCAILCALRGTNADLHQCIVKIHVLCL